MFHLDILTNIENFIYTEEETLQFIEESILIIRKQQHRQSHKVHHLYHQLHH